MKLELKHLAPYLPYGLMLETSNGIISMDALNDNDEVRYHVAVYADDDYYLSEVKPILRPLSSITEKEAKGLMLTCLDFVENIKVSTRKGMVIIQGFWFYDYWHLAELTIDIKTGYINIEHDEDTTVETIGYEIYEWLFQHHFDVFNLIDKDLAISK